MRILLVKGKKKNVIFHRLHEKADKRKSTIIFLFGGNIHKNLCKFRLYQLARITLLNALVSRMFLFFAFT